MKYIISMVAVMRKEKDYETYIECAAEMCKERDDVAFLCIGHGPQLEYYQKKVSSLQEKRIQVLGFRYDVENYFKASYLSVLCDTASESLSNSIVESMAMGTPVLATNCGGTPEIISDGENGVLLEYRNPQQLKSQIEQLMEHPEKRDSMSRACVETISQKFEIQRMTEEFISVFNAR